MCSVSVWHGCGGMGVVRVVCRYGIGMVRVWCRCGIGMVQAWYVYGADMVQARCRYCVGASRA